MKEQLAPGSPAILQSILSFEVRWTDATRDGAPTRKRKTVWIISGLCLMFVATALAAWFLWRRPEITPALRGQEIATKMGCFACHGAYGVQGIADPTSPAGRVPGWDAGTVAMYVTSEEDIREWILFGARRKDSVNGVPTSARNLVPMPAYQGRLSDRELEDLVAYFRASSGWALDIPDNAYEGRKIAVRLGCFGCHGPSGMGGVTNPGSFKGQIPPWNGDGFAEVVRNGQDLRDWILHGQPGFLRTNPIARYFLRRQSIQMPAYQGHLSDQELDKLVAYIRWLRSMRSK